MKTRKRILIGLLLSTASIACQSPREDCQMDVEDVYQPVCLIAIAANSRQASDNSLTGVLLACSEYLQKKDECGKKFY